MAKPNFAELIRYGISGATVLATDYALLNFTYVVLKWPLLVATLVSFVAAAFVGYAMHSRVTFRYDTRGEDTKKLPMFVGLYSVGLGITELVMHFLAERGDINHNIAKAVAVVIVTVIQYSAMKWIIFKKD